MYTFSGIILLFMRFRLCRFSIFSLSLPPLFLPLSNCFTFRTQFTLYLANVVVRRNVETLRFMEYARAGYDYAQFDVRTMYLTSWEVRREGEGDSQQLDSKKRIRGPRLIFSSVSRWRTRSDNSSPSTLFR